MAKETNELLKKDAIETIFKYIINPSAASSEQGRLEGIIQFLKEGKDTD